jgi:hypothetical protein
MKPDRKLIIPRRSGKLSARDRYHLNGMLSRNLRILVSGKGTLSVDDLWRLGLEVANGEDMLLGPTAVSEKLCKGAEKWALALKVDHRGDCCYLEYLVATWIVARVAKAAGRFDFVLTDERDIIPMADPPKKQPKGDKPLPGQVFLFGGKHG